MHDRGYPLAMTHSLPLNMAIEIASFPVNSLVIVHNYIICKRLPEGIIGNCPLLHNHSNSPGSPLAIVRYNM